jgi:HK97 family phage portal protein
MGLKAWLKGEDLMEDRAIKPDPGESREIPLYGLPTVWSGTDFWHLQPTEALAVADVWSAVRVLADAVSSLPLHVYRKTADGRERVTSGKLVELLERPSPGVTEADLTSTLMTHLAVWGNAFVAKYRRQGEVVQLGLIHPDRIRPEIVNGQLRFRYDPPKGPQQLLTEADVVHVKGLSVDGMSGLSAVGQAARVLGLSDSLVKHAMSFFESSTPRPAGLLRFANPPDQAGELAPDRMMERVRNELRPHGILAVYGDTTYESVDEKMDDNQFVEQRRLAAQEVCRVFRIPSHMLNAGTGGDSLTYSTSESMSADFVKYSLAPWLRRIELAVSTDPDLCFQRQFVKFSVDALLRADARTRAEVYEKGLIMGWLDVDEVRALEDFPPKKPPATQQPIVEQVLPRPREVASNGNG